MRAILWTLILLSLLFAGDAALADEARFPQPQFESGYVLPETPVPVPRALLLEYLDVAVLIGVLLLAGYLALRLRSRRALFLLTIFSLLYFGFWRKGCVCAVGALQNVTQALSVTSSILPLVVTAFFLLPLIFTLLFGRVFCSSVCPLGAIQDLVVVRPMRVPAPLGQALGMLPYLYLGLVVLFAATGAGYMICRFDPFVSFFRLSGSAGILYTGAGFLIAGTVLARPYCRFLCPYGVLLKWVSRFSKKHLTITPDVCVQCRLCENSCPFGAIRKPSEGMDPGKFSIAGRRSVLLAALLPALVIGGVYFGSVMKGSLSLVHPTVRLADRVSGIDSGQDLQRTVSVETFLESERSSADLFGEAQALRNRIGKGGMILGGFLGLVFGGKLIGLSVRRERRGYEPDRAECLSCGRCIEMCPVEHVRLHGDEADMNKLLTKYQRQSRGKGDVELTPEEIKSLVDEREIT